MTPENEKIDAVDAISFGLTRTRDWRRRTAAKYPGDPRNARAAECLTKLAADAPSLTDDDWLLLKPYAGWANERFREAISEAARSAGFKKKITDIHSFALHLLEVLSEPQSVAA